MPVYEYKCGKCGEKFELKLGFFQNRNAVKCPKCDSSNVERVFSPIQTNCSSGSSCASPRFR